MATTVYTTKLVDSTHRTLLKIVGTGGGDANTVLVDPGSLLYSLASNGAILGINTNRKTSYRTSIKRIWGQAHIATNKYITLQWQDSANSPLVTFGTGHFDYNFDREGMSGTITTPSSGSPTGNILITSTATTGDAFTLFIDLKKDNRDFDAGQTADPAAFNKAGIP